MQHPIAKYAVSAALLAAILWWPVWLLNTGPLAHFLHTEFEIIFGTFTIVLLCLVAAAAVAVAYADLTRNAPEQHRRFHFRPLMHH